MVTRRKSEFEKARGEMRRGLHSLIRAVPVLARLHWRDLVMPWRRLSAPVALALIALVALAMILDTGENVNADPVLPEGAGVMVGGDVVAPGTRCEEDEVITYRVLMGGEGVGCVHYDYVVMEFLDTCIIGNSEVHPRVTPNLATLHLRDDTFRSWCDAVVDDVSDGVVSLDDLLFDVATMPGYTLATPEPTPTATSAGDAVSPHMTITPTAVTPKSLPSTGSR